MHAPNIAWSLILPLALAAPLEPRDDAALREFVITDLGATLPYPYPPYGLPEVDSHIDIQVNYTDPKSTTATLSTTCSAAWPKGTDPGPTNWTACAAPELQFRLPRAGWTGSTNFVVEFWETLTAGGSGLDGSHLVRSDPGNPSDPDAYLFCIQMGKFNPLTCSLTGPLGQSHRTVVIPAVEESGRPA